MLPLLRAVRNGACSLWPFWPKQFRGRQRSQAQDSDIRHPQKPSIHSVCSTQPHGGSDLHQKIGDFARRAARARARAMGSGASRAPGVQKLQKKRTKTITCKLVQVVPRKMSVIEEAAEESEGLPYLKPGPDLFPESSTCSGKIEPLGADLSFVSVISVEKSASTGDLCRD